MKRLLVGLFLAFSVAGTALLADTSHTYGPLAQSATFKMRVSFLIAEQAAVVLAEAQTNGTPPNTYTASCHTLRAALAQGVARNPDGYAPVFASNLVSNVNVTTAGAPTGSLAAGTLDTPATDAALLAAVALEWSTISGCIINP